MGFMSSVIGLASYALSSSFKHLFGEWNFFKITVYAVVSFSISSLMLFLKKWKLSRSFLLKVHSGVLVLLLTSFYSFVSDKDVSGKPDMLSLISCAAFAVMSLCLSKQIDLGFGADLLNFFLGCLTVQLMKINLMLSIFAAIFCYCLMVLRSKLDSQTQIGTLRMEDHVAVDIDAADQGQRRGNGHRQIQSLTRRVEDGYNWKQYEEKNVKRSENQKSYYKCTYPNCPVRKRVERSIVGETMETLYKGNHNHYKPTFTMKRNSSSEYLYSVLPSETIPADMPDQSFASHGRGGLDDDDDAKSENSAVSI